MRCAISPNDRRIADLVRALDREEQSAAESWRLVATAAEQLGLRRPSYGHVRRLVRVERALRRLRAEARAILTDAGLALLAGRVPPVLRVIDEVTEILEREELVLQEHKPPPPG
jgi:hypothetical protein